MVGEILMTIQTVNKVINTNFTSFETTGAIRLISTNYSQTLQYYELKNYYILYCKNNNIEYNEKLDFLDFFESLEGKI